MYLVPGYFIYIATPRTSSRTMKNLIMRELPQGVQLSKSHHPERFEIVRAKMTYTEPMIGFVRHPLDHYASWCNLTNRRGLKVDRKPYTFKEFLELSSPMQIRRSTQDRLQPNEDFIEHWFILGKTSHQDLLAQFGLMVHQDIIDKYSSGMLDGGQLTDVWDDGNEEVIKQRFPEDWALYNKILKEKYNPIV
jgi:hypothetical protein